MIDIYGLALSFLLIFIIVISVSLYFPTFLIDETYYKIGQDKITMDIAPFNSEGVIYLPVIYVAQALKIDKNDIFKEDNKLIVNISGNKSLILKQDMPARMSVADEKVELKLAHPVKTKDCEFFLSIEDIKEIFNVLIEVKGKTIKLITL